MKLKYFIISTLWKLPFVRRNYCWANAVLYVNGFDHELFEPADHKCFYCLACNTQAEIDEHFKENSNEQN